VAERPYLLYAEDATSLLRLTSLYERFMEPRLAALEASIDSGVMTASLPELRQYLEVCRWPFRKLEYSFALDALVRHLQPGDRYLDAGCGVTPFAHAIAGWQVEAVACDADGRLIDGLRASKPERIYGTFVTYATQDLRETSFPDASFDAISCISVLEHIPAPDDQRVIHELMRLLKPRGILVMTLDFTPSPTSSTIGRWRYYARRVANLARDRQCFEIAKGAAQKIRARHVVRRGLARQPRSANQCFEIEHLERDILPLLEGEPVDSGLPFSTDLRSATPNHAMRLWRLQPGVPSKVRQRAVLPAGYILRRAERGAETAWSAHAEGTDPAIGTWSVP
jgi:2-polyprenyl-3-methyl-5-hydroxy-6-metoxy-1,4-benzoquinol methylase